MNSRNWPSQGNQHPSHAPHNVYRAARGESGVERRDSDEEEAWIAIDVGSDAEWFALCRVMGEPAWARDSRFESSLSRWQHRDELDTRIAAWTADKEVFGLWRQLTEAGVIAGPVQNERDVFACPQLGERGFFEELDHPEFGPYRYPGLNFRMSQTPNHLRRHPVRLGEDNDYVYREILGISDEEHEHLTRLGHIGMDYPHALPAAAE